MTDPMFLTRKQAGEITNTSEDTIRRAINKGTLRAKRVGDAKNARYLVSREALQAWFEQLDDA